MLAGITAAELRETQYFMSILIIRIPVTCPVCDSTVTTAFNAAEMLDALLNSRPVRLYAGCHNIAWYANDWEVQKIREYFYEASLECERKKNGPRTE